MSLFEGCGFCEHIKEIHALDAPRGKRECLEEGCNCPDWNFDPDRLITEEEAQNEKITQMLDEE